MKNKNSWLAAFAISLIVGLIIAFIEFLLPRIIDKEKKELSFSISKPITLIDDRITKDLDIRINDEPANNLFSHQLFIKNTGKLPLKNTPSTIIFNNTDEDFFIYSINIETIPQHEFGNIYTDLASKSIRLVVELFNPSDEVHLSILTNSNKSPELFAKSEGMQLKKVLSTEKVTSPLIIIISIFASLISLTLLLVLQQKGLIKIDLAGLTVSFDELNKAKTDSGLKVLFATYGKNDKVVDVADILNKKITDNKLQVRAQNSLFGDPARNIPKELRVVYSFGNKIETTVISENGELQIPPEKND